MMLGPKQVPAGTADEGHCNLPKLMKWVADLSTEPAPVGLQHCHASPGGTQAPSQAEQLLLQYQL